jgi:cobalt/nickel transport protein
MKQQLLLAVIALYLLVSGCVAKEDGWSGTDELAEKKVEEITGGEYKPWFKPIWEPPSGEIETFLFSLQAAIGALIIGYFIGYYRGKARR